MSASEYVSRAEFETLLQAVQDLQARVTEVASLVGPPSASATSAEFKLVGLAEVTAPVAEAAAELSQERLLVPQEIGIWLRHCLDGERRGLSGREKLSLQSRFYVVVRGFDLVVHDPPRVFTSWTGARAVTHQHGHPGDSIFVGVPSKAEVRAVCAAAGLTVPSACRR